MNDLVLITSYNRPDYLRLCLEYLAKTDGIKNKEIRIYVDRGYSLIREFYEVVNDFRCSLNPSVSFRGEHSYHGNSYNTLEAYKEAYQSDAKYVYLVEDDVLVMPDFFKWHEAVQETGDYMCSVAYHCLRNSDTAIGCADPAAYFISGRDYASIGVCWKREKLRPIVQHAKKEYYENLNAYILTHFPNNRFAECFTEQDGLIMRILGDTNEHIAWSYVPRCYHVGFASYNRPRGPRLSYSELKEIIHTQEKINAASVDFHDIEPMPKKPIAAWDKLYCIQRIN